MILLWRLLFQSLLVEMTRGSLRDFMEEQFFRLFNVAANRKALLPKRRARIGRPFLGKARCYSCFNKWTVFTREGCHESIKLTCGRCGKQAGELV